MSYMPDNLDDDVICPESGCEGCEHGEKHKYMSVDSTCEKDDEGNCPGCILFEDYKPIESGGFKMREHPILFSTEMIKAILEGRKTQTRRVIKKQRDYWKFAGKHPISGYWFSDADLSNEPKESTIWQPKGFPCPYSVGQHLWVREKLQKHLTGTPVRYFADGCPVMRDGESAPLSMWTYRYDVLPSIFMPRWASRIILEVTEIRVQRLWEITPEDCIAEGLSSSLREHDACIDLCRQYKELWDKLNSKRGYGWDKNPWVFAISFRKLEASK